MAKPPPALIRRFPNPRYRPETHPIVSAEAAASAGAALAQSIDVVRQEIEPAFAEADLDALRAQNRFRGLQVVAIAMAAVAAIAGALQAAVGDDSSWPGIVQAVAGAVAGGAVVRAWSKRARSAYLRRRLQAERLRGEAFLFIGGVGYPADPGEARAKLVARVAQIAGEGPAA